MSHVLIHLEDLLGALDEQAPCRDCAVRFGVHVENGSWHVVQLHASSCVGQKPRTVRLPDTDSHIRCRSCGGLLLHDVGGSVFGEVEGEERCPRCDPRPSTFDTWDAA